MRFASVVTAGQNTMHTISRVDLDRLCPRPKSGQRQVIWDQYAEAIEQAGPLFDHVGINDNLKLCHVLAQWGAETGGFTLLWESGNYSADRIVQIFGKGHHSAKVTRDEAEDIADLPAGDERAKALFERVYGLGNPKKAAELGNAEPGDGWKYRGFGIQQITGKTDHMKYLAGEYTALRAVVAALMEWRDKGCTALAGADDCLAVTRKINGGTNGLGARKALLAQAKEIWLEDDHDAAPAQAEINTLVDDRLPPKSLTKSKSLMAQAVALPAMVGGLVSQVKGSVDQIQQTTSDAAALGIGQLAVHHISTPMILLSLLGIGALLFIARERLAKLWEGI